MDRDATPAPLLGAESLTPVTQGTWELQVVLVERVSQMANGQGAIQRVHVSLHYVISYPLHPDCKHAEELLVFLVYTTMHSISKSYNVSFILLKEYNFRIAILFVIFSNTNRLHCTVDLAMVTIVNKPLLASGFCEIYQWYNLAIQVSSKPYIVYLVTCKAQCKIISTEVRVGTLGYSITLLVLCISLIIHMSQYYFCTSLP